MKYLTTTIFDIFHSIKQSIEIFIVNFAIFSIIALCLDISPNYLLLSYAITSGLSLFLGKNVQQKFDGYLVILSISILILNKYGFFPSMVMISLLTSIILYLCRHFNLIKYFEIFPKEIYSAMAIVSALTLITISLKYCFGLKSSIKYEYFYQNIFSIYKNLKFSNWQEIILAAIGLFSSIFFIRFEMKNFAFFYSLIISMLFCCYFKNHGLEIHTLFENIQYIEGKEKFSFFSLSKLKIPELLDYIYSSIFISGLMILNNLINNKITDVKEQNYANYRSDIKNLSIINLLSGILSNMLNFANIEQYRKKYESLNYIYLINFLQMTYAVLIITFGQKIFLYIPKSSVGSLVIIISLRLMLLNKFADKKFFYYIFTPSFIFFAFFNVLEYYKMIFLMSLILIIRRFAGEKIKDFLKVTNNKYNPSLEQKIKNSIIYKIENNSFFGVISHHLNNAEISRKNLILDITNIQNFDEYGVNCLREMVIMQIKSFKEIIICCDHQMSKQLKSAIDLPIRIIAISEDDI